MSLAMFAAPFGDNDSSSSTAPSSTSANTNSIQRKRNQNNKTIKQRYNASSSSTKESFDLQKVNSVLEQLQMDSGDSEESNGLGDFQPPPMPQSAGVQKTIATEQMQNNSSNRNDSMLRSLGRAPQPSYDSVNGDKSLEMNDYTGNYGDAEEYYRRVLPGYQSGAGGPPTASPANGAPMNRMYYAQPSSGYENIGLRTSGTNNDVFLQKLNYMIHLLEEQQDERTNNVTEEVVLYSFLGIFIIFIVDSFARVGKYVR